MKGVILFADDQIFDSSSTENGIFQKFNSDENFSILPINNLTTLENTVVSISTIKALILDWNFKKESEEEGVKMPDENPYEFLISKKLYSLVYVYSQEDIPEDKKSILKELYPNKIFFESKGSDDPVKEYEKIINGIERFEENNKHLTVPFIWSQAINQSSQAIFSELELADPNWISEVYHSASSDGAEPKTEVIGIFQNLLNETIVQDSTLINALSEPIQTIGIAESQREESLAKLYNRIYYTKLVSDAPIMTGDIFKFSDVEFGILITPECDVNSKKENALDFLVFNKGNFDKSKSRDLVKSWYEKVSQENSTPEFKGKLGELIKDYNNGKIKNHILPSFPFEKDVYNLSALIDFETAFVVKPKAEFDSKRSEFKLNSPYIYQLRQRYLAFIGRVGVPAIPNSLRLYNLK